jgi:hypothetical protein
MRISLARLRIDLFLCAGLVAAGCATGAPNDGDDSPVQRALIGKTGEAIRACAGPPVYQRSVEGKVLWIYYKEASQLEESFFGSKSSYAMVHHGCRATLMFENDQVAGVTYKSEPSSYQDEDHCEEIFQSCINQ